MEKDMQQKVTTTEVVQHDCFLIVKTDKGYNIVLGNSIISQRNFKSVDDAKKYINKKPYELIFNGSIYISQKIKEENK